MWLLDFLSCKKRKIKNQILEVKKPNMIEDIEKIYSNRIYELIGSYNNCYLSDIEVEKLLGSDFVINKLCEILEYLNNENLI